MWEPQGTADERCWIFVGGYGCFLAPRFLLPAEPVDAGEWQKNEGRRMDGRYWMPAFQPREGRRHVATGATRGPSPTNEPRA